MSSINAPILFAWYWSLWHKIFCHWILSFDRPYEKSQGLSRRWIMKAILEICCKCETLNMQQIISRLASITQAAEHATSWRQHTDLNSSWLRRSDEQWHQFDIKMMTVSMDLFIMEVTGRNTQIMPRQAQKEKRKIHVRRKYSRVIVMWNKWRN